MHYGVTFVRFQDKTPEAKKYRKEENGGGGEPERIVDFPEDDEEPEIEEEDEEDDIGEGEEDELEGEGMPVPFRARPLSFTISQCLHFF